MHLFLIRRNSRFRHSKEDWCWTRRGIWGQIPPNILLSPGSAIVFRNLETRIRRYLSSVFTDGKMLYPSIHFVSSNNHEKKIANHGRRQTPCENQVQKMQNIDVSIRLRALRLKRRSQCTASENPMILLNFGHIKIVQVIIEIKMFLL